MDDLRFFQSDHAEVLADLERAVGWLGDLKVSIDRRRHSHYLKTLRDVVRDREDGSAGRDATSESIRAVAVAILEADQLIRIWRGFRQIDTKELRQALRLVVKGPTDFADESPQSSRPRNTAFELDCASSLAAAGCEVLFYGDADVDVALRGFRYFMECKRPQGERGLRDGMDAAVCQLERRLDESPVASYGLLAFSVGQLYWPSGLIVQGQTPHEIRDRVVQWTGDFNREFRESWIGHDRRIVGAMVDAPFLGRITDTPIWVRGHLPTIVALCPQGSEEFAHMMTLRDKMMSGEDRSRSVVK